MHAYVFATKGCKKWDTCAPEAILHAVGGTLTDIHGIRMDYGKDVQRLNAGGVLATTSNHKYFLDRMPKDVKDNLEKSAAADKAPRGAILGGVNDWSNEDSSLSPCQEEQQEQQQQQIQTPSPPPIKDRPESGSSTDSNVLEKTKF